MAEGLALERFIAAQEPVFSTVLAELRRGAKRSHWMWFIFPQHAALGSSSTAKFYGLMGAAEAKAYMADPLLGPRYLTCVEALQDLRTSDAAAVFGAIDALKLRSSLTLFEATSPYSLFTAAIDRWFGGERDPVTLELLNAPGR